MPTTEFTELEQAVRDAMADNAWSWAAALGEQLDKEDRMTEEQRRQEDEDPFALARAAMFYARHGVPVFPCNPRKKDPLGRFAPNGFQDATTDLNTISMWWTQEPQANIGAPTGELFDVIDVDGEVGHATIQRWEQGLREQSLAIVGTPYDDAIAIVNTPRTGGTHYYVRAGTCAEIAGTGVFTGNHRNGVPGVDLRGRGGYVLLPPSVTDEHGPDRRYVWVKWPAALQAGLQGGAG